MTDVPKNYLRWLLTLHNSPQFHTAILWAIDGVEYIPPSKRPWKPHPPDETIGGWETEKEGENEKNG